MERGFEKGYGCFYIGKYSKQEERQVEGISGKKEGKHIGEAEFEQIEGKD